MPGLRELFLGFDISPQGSRWRIGWTGDPSDYTRRGIMDLAPINKRRLRSVNMVLDSKDRVKCRMYGCNWGILITTHSRNYNTSCRDSTQAVHLINFVPRDGRDSFLYEWEIACLTLLLMGVPLRELTMAKTHAETACKVAPSNVGCATGTHARAQSLWFNVVQMEGGDQKPLSMKCRERPDLGRLNNPQPRALNMKQYTFSRIDYAWKWKLKTCDQLGTHSAIFVFLVWTLMGSKASNMRW